MSEQDRAEAAEWRKELGLDPNAGPGSWYVVQDLQFIAHCYREADADAIIADHRKAAKADGLAKALDMCAAAIDEVRANIDQGIVAGRDDWPGRFDPHSRMAAAALADWAEVAAPCQHKNTGTGGLLNWCVDCGAIRQAVGTEWEKWQLPKTQQRAEVAAPEEAKP